MEWAKRALAVDMVWRELSSAPRDGTPILVAQGGLVGIYAFFDVGDRTLRGDPMWPDWRGVHVLSEFTPVMQDGEATRERIVIMGGVDEDAVWMPLPLPPAPLDSPEGQN